MGQTIKTEPIKDVISNLKDALYWTNRVGNDPAQASLAITQAITLLSKFVQEVGDKNQ